MTLGSDRVFGRGIKAGALFSDIGEIAVTDNLRIGIVLLEIL